MNLILILFLAVFVNAQEENFEPTAESLIQYEVPEWYEDAKLGYWVTWGVYSVPAFAGDHAAEWYGRWMYAVDDGLGKEKGPGYEKRGLKTAAYHRSTYGDPSEFGYKDLIPLFKAEHFDADEWADLFKEGGARFFTMMAMHHDNYCMWNTENTPYNSVETGPGRDFVLEMGQAIRARGMHFGVSNHSAWNGHFFEFNHMNGFDAREKNTHALYGTGSVDSLAIKKWWETSIELAEKYKPDLYYFDWGWNIPPFGEQHRMDFCSHYYNKALEWNQSSFPGPGVVVNYKGRERLPVGAAVLDLERGGMKGIEKKLWQNDTSLGLKSWSYAPDEVYRSPNQVVDMLMDIISKNGVLMLNIGPKADGTIPDVAKKTILEIGNWLSINGEAVYATRPWEVFGEGPTLPDESMHGDQVEYGAKDIRFTRSKENQALYVTFLGWPGEEAVVQTLKTQSISLDELGAITMFGCDKVLEWTQDEDGLHVKFPKESNPDSFAYALKLNFKKQIPYISIFL